MDDHMKPQKVVTNWTAIDTKVKHEGSMIVLPNDPSKMGYAAARETLQRIEDEENQQFDVKEVIFGAPWDVAVATVRAMQKKYGVVISDSIKTFFGEILPDFKTVITGVDDKDRIQIPTGKMLLPGISEPIFLAIAPFGVVLQGKVRKADRAFLVEIANLARHELRENSIYRAQAIRLGVNDEGQLDISKQPEFIDLRHVAETDMIHTDETTAMISTNIFSPLKHTQACRRHRIPLKRGILLEGKYGTGKSLTARVAAKVATDNGWTFILLDRVQGLKTAIEFAKNYQPCVIFAEDIDRAADRSDEGVNDLVNMMDGLISKDMEVMTILTTNFVEKIDKALLRPGRFDAVISIQTPDSFTVQRLVRAYARDLLPGGVDLTRVGEAIQGQIPATVREVVERAKLSMLMEERKQLTAMDLEVSALGMKRHTELLNNEKKEPTPRDMFCEGLIGMVGEALMAEVELNAATPEQVQKLENNTINGIRKIREDIGSVARTSAAGAEASEKGRKVGEKIYEKVSGRG